MIKIKNILFGFSICILGLCACKKSIIDNDKPLEVPKMELSYNQSYRAGNDIRLHLMGTVPSQIDKSQLQLFINHGLSTTSMSVSNESDLLFFKIPPAISEKSGVVAWSLFYSQKEIEIGSFSILPSKTEAALIPAFLGPPSILAGGKDHSMLVVIATDTFDNPLTDGHILNIATFGNNIAANEAVKIKNSLYWERIYATQKSGKIKVGVASEDSYSKELEVLVGPNTPREFNIYAQQMHPYADGHELLKLTTSSINDSYQNIVADGTLVAFKINTSQGHWLTAQASTINGVAQTFVRHPELPSDWSIQGHLDYFATSDTIQVRFKPYIDTLPVTLDSQNRIVNVGPITGHLGQLIPDGAIVTATFNTIKKTLQTTTKNGRASFSLTKELRTTQTQKATVCALGICQTITILTP